MERQEMQTDIAVAGFGPAAAGFLTTLAPELAKTKEDGSPLYESTASGREWEGVGALQKRREGGRLGRVWLQIQALQLASWVALNKLLKLASVSSSVEGYSITSLTGSKKKGQ